MIYCILGCQGFIGHHLVERLLKDENNYIYGIDKMTYCANRDIPLVDRFKFIEEDICNLTQLPECNTVINCAAESHVDNSINDPSQFLKTNILGVANILELLKKIKIENRPIFIHFSTDETFGDHPPKTGFDENATLNPSSPYSASKAAGDLLIGSYKRTYNVTTIIVKPTNIFGCGQYPEKLISKNLRNLDRGNKVLLYGNGSNKRTWLYIDDLLDVLEKIIKYSSLRKNNNEIFNISGDIISSNKQTLINLIKAYHSELRTYPDDEIEFKYFSYTSNRNGEDIEYIIDDTKVRRCFDWKPKYTNFKACLDQIVKRHKGSIKYWM